MKRRLPERYISSFDISNQLLFSILPLCSFLSQGLRHYSVVVIAYVLCYKGKWCCGMIAERKWIQVSDMRVALRKLCFGLYFLVEI